MYDDLAARADTDYTDPEDRDEYMAENVFWVPKEARWSYIQASAKQPTIGKSIDEAMLAIEKENPKRLKGVLPTGYARPDLDKTRLGELIDLISTIGLGDEASRSQDILGRVYEYFLGQFAEKEGKGGGEFYTPRSVVKLLVAVMQPYKGRVYDPCCGSGGMFVQSEKFVEAHGGRKDGIAIYGQESNPTTRRLCLMNLAIRGIEGNIGDRNADSFTGTYQAWRGEPGAGIYEDVPGFCKSATLEEIASHSYVLTPGRYVGAEALEEDDEPFEEKMARLTKTLKAQFAESAKLEAAIRENLRGLGL